MPSPPSEVMVRTRRESDVGDCIAALRTVHATDHYPLNWPTDAEGWLSPPGMLQAWVAELPGRVIAGHLALLQYVSAGDDAGAFAHPSAEVTRLFVTPTARRSSVASALVTQAARWVSVRGLQLTLNVVDEQQSSAIVFYESTGWRHTHTTMADWTSEAGDSVYLRHYVL